MTTEATTRRATLTEALASADEAHRVALQAAAGGYGRWGDVRQAGEAVKQCRAALKAVGGGDE